MASTRVPKLALTRKYRDIAVEDELRIQLFDNDERRQALVETVKRYEATVKKMRQKATREAALLELQDVKCELQSYSRRLKERVLRKKRQQIYEDGQRELLTMPIDEYKARMKYADLSKMTLGDIIDQFACPTLARGRGPEAGVQEESAVQVSAEKVGARTCSREESLARRLKRRSELMGFELDAGERALVATIDQPALVEVNPAAPVEGAAPVEVAATPVEAAGAPIGVGAAPIEVAGAQVEVAAARVEEAAATPVEVTPGVAVVDAVTESYKGPAKRAAEDALLVEYEASGI